MFYSVWSNNMGGGAVPPGPSPGSATGSLSSSYRAFPEQPLPCVRPFSKLGHVRGYHLISKYLSTFYKGLIGTVGQKRRKASRLE